MRVGVAICCSLVADVYQKAPKLRQTTGCAASVSKRINISKIYTIYVTICVVRLHHKYHSPSMKSYGVVAFPNTLQHLELVVAYTSQHIPETTLQRVVPARNS